mmetsp:Transcript_15235/g.45987  ORF Transcript_15235/g.45987 Transcript_15235/m.45987 type:complete len:247 (+) Transcript_15235:242-982(+)
MSMAASAVQLGHNGPVRQMVMQSAWSPCRPIWRSPIDLRAPSQCSFKTVHLRVRCTTASMQRPASALSCRPLHLARNQPASHARCVAAAAAAATAEDAPVLERLQGEDAERWQAALDEVQRVGFSSEEAAQVLERAFGWRSQVFWRGIKKEEIPDPAQVAATLAFLREDIGLKDADIQAAIKKFPEGLASDVEDRLKPNMQVLEKQFYIPKKNLGATVKRQPKALGFNYDCEGSCEGECHRCWVRF